MSASPALSFVCHPGRGAITNYTELVDLARGPRSWIECVPHHSNLACLSSWTQLVDSARGPNECVASYKFDIPELVDPARGSNECVVSAKFGVLSLLTGLVE